MKNRILSSALAFVLIFTSIIAVFPITSAAESASGVTVTLGENTEDAVAILESYKTEYLFDTAEEMLEYELAAGYLDSVISANYALYVNRYIGTVYYKNLVTGQVLSSNPYDHNKTTVSKEEGLYSQIEIEYSSLSDSSGTAPKYYSSTWIAEGFGLEMSKLENGIRIFYTLGFQMENLLAPAAIMREDFDAILADPMFAKLAELMETQFGPLNGSIYIIGSGNLTSYNISECDSNITRRYGCYDGGRITTCTNAIADYALECVGNNMSDPRYVKVKELCDNINSVCNNYQMYAVERLKNADGSFKSDKSASDYSQWCELIPALADTDNAAAYVIKEPAEIQNYSTVSSAVRAIFGSDIAVDTINAAFERTRYVSTLESSPWFTCALEYTLDNDGALYVNIPGASIDYNDEYYAINSITPIKYFGCGNLYLDGKVTSGYGFIPDGSGAVVEFADILSLNANISSKVYGQDACYSYIGNGKPNEQVVMPVYGIVNEEKAGATLAARAGVDTTVTGFFTVIESGASMSSISLISNNGSGKVCAYNSYSPYPSDRYDLSKTLSVGGTSYYNMIAKTHYDGDCKTRINMLTDDVVAENLGITNYYPSTYVGMASCYKDYLKAIGVIDEILTVSNDMPLYIEALGSIDIVKKILTFPVTVSTPLTEFDDVEQMYVDFINASQTLKNRAADERAAAEALEGQDSGEVEDQIRSHIKKAEKYEALAEQVDSIVNINFKLTGFANGGMHYTYPAKLKWERSVGGKNGFKDLVAAAKAYNQNEKYTIGIYPDFNFLYINNTAMFDGIGLNRSAARLVDNRYASKQSWNSLINVNGIFEVTTSLLVSSAEFDRLFAKFDKKYSGYDNPYLSVSTLGSDLNSNFDEDNLVTREQSLQNTKALLKKMSEDSGYSLMTDIGNIYAVEYVDHILNATIDSSHLKNASYTVPFYGLVLHGYVNYAGTPINYSGSPDYDILRAIENGASLYYVLCCQNTNYLKEDPELSKHYGINYYNWFEKILVQYKTLNDAIGALQNYEITDHKTLRAERIIYTNEMQQNYIRLVKELVNDKIDVNLRAVLDARLAQIRASENYADYIGKQITIHIDAIGIAALAMSEFNMTREELTSYGYEELLAKVADSYKAEGYNVIVYINGIDAGVICDLTQIYFGIDQILEADGTYKSAHDYITDSSAIDKNYDYTDFTCDNGNVVMVKYTNAATGEEEIFFLNYNMFAVDIAVDNKIDKSLADGERVIYRVTAQGFLKLSDAKAND